MTAAGLLVVGLLVLVPDPVAAIQPQAPIINVLDRDTGTANTLQTKLTTTVVIPRGEVIPLSHVSVERISGTPTGFDGDGTLTGGATCSSGLAIQSIRGGSLSTAPVQLGGYGYSSFSSNGYGYGYDFSGSPAFFDFGTFDNGYGLGFGYGYGYGATSDTTMTVVVVVNDCPAVTEFTGNTALTFTFQVLIGGHDDTGDGGKLFVSLPATVTLVNPELTASGTAATAGTVTTAVQTGTGGTTISYTFPGDGDGTHENLPTGAITLPIPSGTPFMVSLTATITGAVPEGSTLGVTFLGAGTNGLNIGASDLASLTGTSGGAAAFLGISLSGFSSATTFITLTMDVEIPTTYFTANGFSTSLFRMARFTDAGVRSTPDPTCAVSVTAPTAGNQRYTCTISSFSAFAMVSSVAGGGGGGGGASSTTSTVTGAVTNTGTTVSTVTNTGTTSSTESASQTDSASQTVSQTTSKPGRGGSAPGLEFGLLVAALAGLALLARRKFK
ncbi:MAG: hypothetical protein ACYC2H_06395 [Thermoplasmatota archaeon]